MISPQSIAVACAATGLVGNESGLFRFTVRHSLLMVALVGLLTWLQATVLHWMVPLGR
jgi:lactate permease